MAASPFAIEIVDLEFRWRKDDRPCLAIPRLTVGAGEQIFLHGPSGSGKSTLLNLVAGVLLPRRGEIRVLERCLAALSSVARDRFRVDHVGFIFQQFNLIPYLSVLDNVLLPCRFSRRRRERAIARSGCLHDEAQRLLVRLDLAAELWARHAAALSVGEQQRVAAARALAGSPEIVIADEPTSSLDADRQAAFLDLLCGECEGSGAALLFVSHDRRLASRFHREVGMAQINHVAVTEGK
jgi:putative ABC transport system ATP-binding protein